MNPSRGGSKDRPFAQVAREGLLVLVSVVTYGSMERRPVRSAVPEFPELADEAV